MEYAELTFLLIKAVSALEKRDLLYTRCDRLLDAVEDGDEEAASLQMREMGLDPACAMWRFRSGISRSRHRGFPFPSCGWDAANMPTFPRSAWIRFCRRRGSLRNRFSAWGR